MALSTDDGVLLFLASTSGGEVSTCEEKHKQRPIGRHVGSRRMKCRVEGGPTPNLQTSPKLGSLFSLHLSLSLSPAQRLSSPTVRRLGSRVQPEAQIAAPPAFHFSGRPLVS
eukprot:scaffold136078_cov22-Tisochrysis_lutea.AAC.2